MSDNNDNFVSILKKISDENPTLVFKVLYGVCKNDRDHQWGNTEVLADKIWIIGRTFAANPERRYISKNNVKIKNNSGDGTERYYSEVAEYIIKNKNELGSIGKLLGEQYNFDFSKKDIEILFDVVSSIKEFNGLIVKASKKYDGVSEINNNYKNQISFCSKFLHFHFPNVVFIKDSNALNGGKYLFPDKNRVKAEIQFPNCKSCIINEKSITGNECLYKVFAPETIEDAECHYLDIVNASDLNKAAKEYAYHIFKAYKTACLFKTIIGEKRTQLTYPKMVDILLLRLKSAQNKET